MKIRVTLYTENDKHIDLPIETVEKAAKVVWEMALGMITAYSSDDEKATVEKVEVIEM